MGNVPIVTLIINGSPANFLFDTGAERTILTAPAAKRLGSRRIMNMRGGCAVSEVRWPVVTHGYGPSISAAGRWRMSECLSVPSPCRWSATSR